MSSRFLDIHGFHSSVRTQEHDENATATLLRLRCLRRIRKVLSGNECLLKLPSQLLVILNVLGLDRARPSQADGGDRAGEGCFHFGARLRRQASILVTTKWPKESSKQISELSKRMEPNIRAGILQRSA